MGGNISVKGDLAVSKQIYRLHYRGQLKDNLSMEQLQRAAEQCLTNVRQAQRQGRVLTAALYRAGAMLFLYYEAIGEPLTVTEPASMKQGAEGKTILESGEDIQTTCISPDELLVPLTPFLKTWPGQQDDRLWVYMYPIYYHSVPESAESWKRTAIPDRRRGRIAFLRSDKLFGYTYFHRAIVEEGLLKGDRYQSIALHENILFSYFEEPKTLVNVRNDASRESEVIRDWLAVDPESHFIHMPEGEGENFMFLPALFTAGAEDAGGRLE